MKARFLVSLCAIGAAIAVASCSKGLGNNPTNPIGDTSPVSTNRPVGLDIGLQPTDPITETCSTGVVVPAIGSFPERDIVLLAFTTASDAINADGAGTPLSRDYVLDGNAASDVFVASICSQDVDTSAFSQSLAGKFRHPRCTTCHSMQADDTNAFVSSAISVQTGGSQPHLGPVPGSAFPNNSPEACAECHDSQDFTTFPVKDWQAPAVSFDLRTKSVQELAIAAGNVPSDEPRHFVTDPRVLWALDSGILPTRGGRNGVADDDHDGIDEASDRDGVIRTVPGGSAVFLQQIEEWGQGGFVTTAADAVCDITLVSRAAYLTAAGNGASSRPQVTWEANSNFSAPGRVGTLFIVFQSDATDLIGGDNNGATDIFRTAVDLVSDSAGNLDLVANGNAVLVSAINGDTTVANGGSTMATVGGMDGNMVAFQSIATDLVTGFGDTNGPNTADIYVRNIATNSTELISHEVSNVANGGNGGSVNPAIDATGSAIAFESNATDMIVADTNGVRDVFYTDISGGNGPFLKVRASLTSAGGEGTGGASGNASIYVAGDGRTLVAYESDKTDLAPSLTATTNVYVFDSNGAGSTLLNQQLSSKSAAIGDGSARNPVISADGANIAFESDATNIDFLRPNDDNGSTDIFLVGVSQALAGTILPHRFSVTTIGSADGDGNSTEPSFGTFSSPSSTFGVGFATYTTAASNLGTPSTTDIMVAFLDETFGVLADFTATPTTGAIPLAVQFTDISVGTPTAWQWDFDNDGTVDSTEQNPSFTYTTGGMFTVALTASNDVGSDAVTKSDLVVAVGPPTADFSATPTSGPAALAVQFTDTSTGIPTSWSWDFGDGNSSIQQNPLHTYNSVGTYTVALTATNTAGSTTETKTDFVQVFSPVVAGFSTSVNSGLVPFPVTFTNSSTGASSYVWDFGDGSATVTTESPTHAYTSAGTFSVTLTANGNGGTDTATDTITANGVVTASFTITVAASPATVGFTNQVVTLDASGSTNATSYAWDLDNDGSTDATGVTVTNTIGNLFPVSAPNSAPYFQNYTIRLTAAGLSGSAQQLQDFRSTAASSMISIPAGQDSTIYSENINYGAGGQTRFVSGRAYDPPNVSSGGIRRALIEFDISGNLIASSTVTSAALTLECTTSASSGPETFNLQRLTTAWVEGSTNVGLPGIGSPADPGDVTWNEASSGATNWTSNGGDFLGAVSSSTSVDANGSYTWPTSASMVSDIQSWLNTPANNHGWILRTNESGGQRSVKWFASRTNGTPIEQPSLTVTFRRPLPPAP
jgi:PKD repeat protein